MLRRIANKKELVNDLIVKAKQVEYLIKSLPEPEPEEEQVCVSSYLACHVPKYSRSTQAKRLQTLDEEMTLANAEYVQAVARSSAFSLLDFVSLFSFLGFSLRVALFPSFLPFFFLKTTPIRLPPPCLSHPSFTSALPSPILLSLTSLITFLHVSRT